MPFVRLDEGDKATIRTNLASRYLWIAKKNLPVDKWCHISVIIDLVIVDLRRQK